MAGGLFQPRAGPSIPRIAVPYWQGSLPWLGAAKPRRRPAKAGRHGGGFQLRARRSRVWPLLRLGVSSLASPRVRLARIRGRTADTEPRGARDGATAGPGAADASSTSRFGSSGEAPSSARWSAARRASHPAQSASFEPKAAVEGRPVGAPGRRFAIIRPTGAAETACQGHRRAIQRLRPRDTGRCTTPGCRLGSSSAQRSAPGPPAP